MKLFGHKEFYPARTLYQPWAGLVWLAAFGWPGKTVETRSKRTWHRGPFVGCAGQKLDRVAYKEAYERLVEGGLVPEDVFRTVCTAKGVALFRFDIGHCRPFDSADKPAAFYDAGETGWSWVPREIAALDPWGISGKPGWFGIDRARVDSRILVASRFDVPGHEGTAVTPVDWT